MTATTSERPNRLFADLDSLHRQLEEMAAKSRSHGESGRQRPRDIEPPVLVIRGK